jgi:AAHS family 4-hydroxybenzoate transporter-like MFS transporter
MAEPATREATFDVAAFLDGMKLTGFHVRLVLLSCLITFFDGLDFALISYSGPYMRDEMHPTITMYGWMLNASVIGQMFGSLICANIADRIGRRPVILVCTVLAAVTTILTGTARSPEAVILWRFLCGLVIGGLLPVAWALNIEAMPKVRRATVVAIIMFGFSLGAAFAGPVTNLLAPGYGWHMVYFVSGAGTFLLSLLLIVTLPESARFLVCIGAARERIEPLLRRFDPGFRADGRFILSDEREEDGANRSPLGMLAGLFKGPLAVITLLIWGAYFASSVGIYLKSQLGPTFLEELGIARQMAAWIGAFSGIAGAIAGMLLLSVTEKRGPIWVALFPVVATPILFLIGFGATGDLFLPAIIVGSILVGGGHAAVISITSIYYPSAIRSNAGGWASFVAKIGASAAPMIGVQFLGSAEQVLKSYILAGGCTLAITVCVLALAHFAKRLKGGRSDELEPAAATA